MPGLRPPKNLFSLKHETIKPGYFHISWLTGFSRFIMDSFAKCHTLKTA